MRKHTKGISKKVAIITGGDCKLLNPAGVFFTSLRNSSLELFKNSVKYYFLYGRNESLRLEKETLRNMGVIVKDVQKFAQDMPEVEKFTKGIVAKFMPFLLQESNLYDISIWCDVDQINIRDLAKIINFAYNRRALFIKGGAKIENQFKCEGGLFARKIKLDEGMKDINFDLEGICGSFYTIKTCPKNSFHELVNLYKKYSDELWLGEQGVLDIFIQRFYVHRGTVELPGNMYTPHPNMWEVEKLIKTPRREWPYFLHSYGSDKFWIVKNPHKMWKKYNKQWLDLKREVKLQLEGSDQQLKGLK